MRTDEPQISFADPEFRWQGVHLDPLLEQVSGFIDEHPELIDAVGRDLERGLKQPQTGRKGLTPNQVLRSLVLMRVKNWGICLQGSRVDKFGAAEKPLDKRQGIRYRSAGCDQKIPVGPEPLTV